MLETLNLFLTLFGAALAGGALYAVFRVDW